MELDKEVDQDYVYRLYLFTKYKYNKKTNKLYTTTSDGNDIKKHHHWKELFMYDEDYVIKHLDSLYNCKKIRTKRVVIQSLSEDTINRLPKSFFKRSFVIDCIHTDESLERRINEFIETSKRLDELLNDELLNN